MYPGKRVLMVSGAALLMLLLAPCVHADPDSSGKSQAGPVTQSASRLQVTGSRQQFSIEADHADVQSALKAVFVQAGKQFDLNNNVAGQLTLKLDSQSLDTVLSSIGRQTFLKYHVDGTSGIYHFEQDTDAVKAAFTRIDTLNVLLRQQLRDIGLDLPGDSQFGVGVNRLSGRALSQSQNRVESGIVNSPESNSLRGGSVAGAGTGGRNGSSILGRDPGSQRSVAADKSGVPLASSGQNSAQNGVASKSFGGAAPPAGPAGAPAIQTPTARYKDGVLNTGNVPDYLVEQLLQAYGNAPDHSPLVTVDKAVEDYLRGNNLVAINTKGAAVPVADVLAEN